MWQALIDGYDADPEQIAISKFRKTLENEAIEFDAGKIKTTPDRETAEEQIKRMIRVYLPHALSLDVARTEVRLRTRLDPLKSYFLTGTPDVQQKMAIFVI